MPVHLRSSPPSPAEGPISVLTATRVWRAHGLLAVNRDGDGLAPIAVGYSGIEHCRALLLARHAPASPSLRYSGNERARGEGEAISLQGRRIEFPLFTSKNKKNSRCSTVHQLMAGQNTERPVNLTWGTKREDSYGVGGTARGCGELERRPGTSSPCPRGGGGQIRQPPAGPRASAHVQCPGRSAVRRSTRRRSVPAVSSCFVATFLQSSRPPRR